VRELADTAKRAKARKSYHLNILGKLLLYVVSIRRRDNTAAYSTTDY
jgi:hypothetical protein